MLDPTTGGMTYRYPIGTCCGVPGAGACRGGAEQLVCDYLFVAGADAEELYREQRRRGFTAH